MINFHESLPLSFLAEGHFLARAWLPPPVDGPAPVWLRPDGACALSDVAATMSGLLERSDLLDVLRALSSRPPICSISDLFPEPYSEVPPGSLALLAPCDLQVVKACGVTFAASTLERVVEERTRGDPRRAAEIRTAVFDVIGDDLTRVTPGSAQSAALKERMSELGLWSQYLEVALGPDAEVFTKAPPLSAVGHGAEIGVRRDSVWNNPEPEIVLAVNSRGDTVGATLGNDVNLRDFEGRSALLLGKAKDNNGACAIGPAIRLFDASFAMQAVREAILSLEIDGLDGFQVREQGAMRDISRDPLELVRQAMGVHHNYPDGIMLFLGTMFAPTQDRNAPGLGFTHQVGDRVAVSAPGLGTLINRVNYCDAIPPWSFGIGALMSNLHRRGLSTSA